MTRLSKEFLFSKRRISLKKKTLVLMSKSGRVTTMLQHGMLVWALLSKYKNDSRDIFDFRVNQFNIDLNEILSQIFKKDLELKVDSEVFLINFINH